MNLLRRFGLALLVGYIFFFYSERMFWSFMRPEDSVFILIVTWLLYSLFTYMFLGIVVHFRVRTVYALFLAGTAFGWIVEGIYAMTFFGAGGMPLPFSIVWTGIACHALITVLIGWYFLQKSLAGKGYLHTIIFSACLGLFWGVWAMAWIFETPPIVTSPFGFIVHAFGTTFLLLAAFFMTSKMRPGSFEPTRIEYGILTAIALAYFILVTLPIVQWLGIILVLAFGVLFVVLNRNRKKESPRSNVLPMFDTKISVGKCLCLLLMPLMASITYIVLNENHVFFRSNFYTLIVTFIGGVLFFAVSIYKVVKKS